MNRIIALSGRKGAGKNTAATQISEWFQQKYGQDVYECSFADTLKEFCIETLGIDRSQCYGTEEEKNTPTEYLWENVEEFLSWKFGTREYISSQNTKRIGQLGREEFYSPQVYPMGHKTGPMTGRDIMQIFGTELVRETFGNVWANATIRRINSLNKPLSLITDNRFPNEIEAVLSQPKGFIIRLTRSPYGDKDLHPSEASLDGFDWNRERCFVVDNSESSIDEQKEQLIPILNSIFGDNSND